MDEISFEERIKISKNGFEKKKLIINPERKKIDEDAPVEISSKVFVPLAQNIKLVKKLKKKQQTGPLDPRFSKHATEDIHGAYETPYGFINDLRKNELEKLYAKRRSKNITDEEYEQVQKEISKVTNQLNISGRKKKLDEAKEIYKKRQLENAEKGIKPSFPNSKQLKTIIKEKDMEELSKNKKKLQKVLKRKKTKEHTKENSKKMPFRRIKKD
eukprot:gene9393-1604_t